MSDSTSIANSKLAALLRECAAYVETDAFDPIFYQVMEGLQLYAVMHAPDSEQSPPKQQKEQPSTSSSSTTAQDVSKGTYANAFASGLGGLGKKFGFSKSESDRRQATSTKNAERARTDLEDLRISEQETEANNATPKPASARPSKPSFQRPVNPNSTLIANGWIEQQRRSRMRTVWKDILASLVEGRRPNEETTLWIQREVTNVQGKPELEALHQIPIKWLERVQYLEFDNRFTLKVYNVGDEFLFRCADEESAQNWVQTLMSVRDDILKNKSSTASKHLQPSAPPSEEKVAEPEFDVPPTPQQPQAAVAAAPTKQRMTVKELRSIAHGAGINTSGMERAELERIVAEVTGAAAGGANGSQSSPQSPSSDDQHQREIEAARLREEHERQEELRRREEQEVQERAQEEAKLAEQRRQLEEEQKRRVTEQRRAAAEEEEKKRAAAAAEEQRRAAAAAEEQRRAAAAAEEQRRAAAAAEEQRRVAAAAAAAEEQRRAAAAAAAAEEQRRRIAEQQAKEILRQEEERRRYAEEQRRRQEEAQRQYQQQQQQWQQYQQQQQWQQQQWQRQQQEAQQAQQRNFYAQQQQQQQQPFSNQQQQGFFPQGNAQQQQQQQSPHGQSPGNASAASMKYAKMADQSQETNGQEKISAIKRNILVHWALQPPMLQMLRPITDLLTSIHTVFPPAFGVAGHEYFAKWKALSRDEVMQGVLPDKEKLKKAVRKLRFFLHPDKLPRDLNDEQQFMCKMLWDVSNDAWEEFTKKQEELDWIQR
mmetsp:Transcript_18810/g.43743  ORF Transcript_18810/g.43743 Transcript_18810/m.43743 type:complete len:767 (+) Transcript_18810:96-2396(+)|eukprot:CAMPEP_0116827258 /NCGR_PEP_ID=MMETSP0418-20121206/2993_1 /TAXON_ID=1158023 /ORGANISM="Astrosyne radiata, Strain 13vi08-1A" /LENGTH=766 /DNA_ID=CAMNT_0004456001 /DNA_START=95 /DNA_END=2395 /DNA_ORIENTATION=-